jgi:DNA processing protein
MASVIRELTPEQLLGRSLNDVEKKHAPAKLFATGNVRLAHGGVRVSIVGARKASEEGRRRARKLAVALANEGVVVVSGLALGIDTAAHTGAIVAGGKTIGVLGTPLDKFYPRENRELQEQIMREHLAVSQFPVGSNVHQGNFPTRNRVMALIADATVIVEASDSSGSISQGWEALRLGRLLYIMKSVMQAPGLTWPAAMLKYGAQVLADTKSLLHLLPVEAGVGELASVAPF